MWNLTWWLSKRVTSLLHQTVLIYVLERQRERMRKRMRERTSCAGSFPTCLQWGLKQGVKNTTRALRRVAGTQLLEPSPLPCKVCIRRKPTRETNQRAANPSPGIWDTGMLNTRLYLWPTFTALDGVIQTLGGRKHGKFLRHLLHVTESVFSLFNSLKDNQSS